MNTHINFVISSRKWRDAGFQHKELAKSVFEAVLEVVPHKVPKKLEISLNLSDDEELQSLNRQFMEKDYATNVLSFPSEVYEPYKGAPKVEDPYLGDIAISYTRIEVESALEGVSFKNHYAHLLTHGILHLMGYDHMNDDEAEVMESLEAKVLAKFSIKNPYID